MILRPVSVMRAIAVIFQVFLFAFLLVEAGCESIPTPEPKPNNNNGSDASTCAHYTPEKIDIIPLTEFAGSDGSTAPQINVYVGLLDAFGSQIKSPGVFRFELYEYVQRSSEHKGKRVMIWPDVDLSEPAENNHYWRDFLRAYEFNLDVETDAGQTYILQVTCLTPNAKRLSAEFQLKREN